MIGMTMREVRVQSIFIPAVLATLNDILTQQRGRSKGAFPCAEVERGSRRTTGLVSSRPGFKVGSWRN